MMMKYLTCSPLAREQLSTSYEARGARSQHRGYTRRLFETLCCVAFLATFGCGLSETKIADQQKRPPLDLVALHSENISPNSQLDGAQKAKIGQLCGDVGADISIRLNNYFLASWIFSLVVCPVLAIICGILAANVYWRILAPKRRVGLLAFLLCVLGGWIIAGSAALVAQKYYVEPKLAAAVASHRTLLQLAQETWIPGSMDELLQDFTANCSDRLQDIASGAQYGDAALARYPTLLESADPLPKKEESPALYWTIIQARAKDMGKLFGVDSGFGQTKKVSSSWREVMDANSRFRFITNHHGGWLIHWDLHPAGTVIVLVGTLLTAWICLLRFSRKVRIQTENDIKEKVA